MQSVATPQRVAVPAARVTTVRASRSVVCNATKLSKPLLDGMRTTALTAASLLSAAPSIADELPIDASAAIEAASNLDPLFLAAGGAVVVLGGGVFALSKSLSAAKVRATTPDKALEAIAQEARVVLVDIRSKQAVKEDGTPDLKSVKRKPVSVPFTQVVGEDIVPVEDFVDKLLANPAIKEDSILILLDSYGQDAPKAAKQVLQATGADTIYFISDGAEGPRGWRALDGPWKKPAPAFSLPALPSLGSLGTSLDEFAEDFKANPTLLKGVLAAGAVAGAGALLLTEVEALLELVGVVAAGRFLTTKLLFAKDRETTIAEFKTLVDDKIRMGEAGDDLKKLAATVLDTEATETPVQAAPPTQAQSTSATDGQVDDAAARKEAAQEWIEAWRLKTRLASSSAAASEQAPSGEESIEARKAAVQGWIGAWRARTSVVVREVVNA